MSSFLDQYEPLDIIGNGSFGIIRKVRRKADGMVLARKELNFERMTERDRKQIVAEVNILKELHHEHIVRYHDRHVDRDAGILYILMEYCGGGDLSTVIKQAARMNRPIPEDTIWNYFMQILLALHHCHHPNGHGRSGSGGNAAALAGDENGLGVGVKERRAQILHRDLKPDNVFLDENNTVKLGDFGLSKALAQSSFANTYVGTPYYMSPELMQEKAYDSKSDIWSLGCLIYELCALKPPFHEAKTHSELNMCIRNGRIPPLPRGYSQSLSAVIKAMLNLNPAMRPSAAQLLQHERLELSFRVSETDRLLSQVKGHRAAVQAKEREVIAKEETLREREQRLNAVLTEKDAEISRLQAHLALIQQQPQITQRDVELAIKQAVARREEELRVLIRNREEEVATAMTRREEEIMDAVRRREAEVCQAWCAREAEIRQEVEVSIKAVQERVEWIMKKEEELRAEEERVEEMREEVEERMSTWGASQKAGKIQKAPLEEVKNILGTHETPNQRYRQQAKTDGNNHQVTPKLLNVNKPFPELQTPITRPNYTASLPSAMKGVILTATGETLATPSPTELVNLFSQSPRVGLGFTKILESDRELPPSRDVFKDKRRLSSASTETESDGVGSPPPSPTVRKEREWKEKEKEKEWDRAELSDTGSSTSSGSGSASSTSTVRQQVSSSGNSGPPTRLRKPSIRASTQRPTLKRTTSNVSASASSASTKGSSTSSSSSSSSTSSSSTSTTGSKPIPRQQQAATTKSTKPAPLPVPVPVPAPKNHPAPRYDPADEENLPSPFLKKVDKEGKVYGKSPSSSAPAVTATTTTGGPSTSGDTVRGDTIKIRPSTSGANNLRALAAANLMRAASAMGISPSMVSVGGGDENLNGQAKRSSLLSAKRASEEARKVLSRS